MEKNKWFRTLEIQGCFERFKKYTIYQIPSLEDIKSGKMQKGLDVTRFF